MFALRTWNRVLLAAMMLLLSASYTFAERGATKLRTTEITTNATTSHPEPSGSPELGVLIIIGVIAFVIFVAWVFSRIGEGHSRPADNTMN